MMAYSKDFVGSIWNQPYSDIIGSTNTIKQVLPDFTLQNPLDRNVQIKQFSIVPDSQFKNRGALQININRVAQPLIKAGFFNFVSKLWVVEPANPKILLRSETIEIWIWNGVDTNKVQISYAIILTDVS